MNVEGVKKSLYSSDYTKEEQNMKGTMKDNLEKKYNATYRTTIAQPGDMVEKIQDLEYEGWSIVAVIPAPNFFYYTIISKKV